jgi:integrase
LAGSSVAQVFNAVSAIFNFTSNELALELRNPFRGVYFDKADGVSKRLPIPTSTIRTIQKSCEEHDYGCRWSVALISDSGLRLSEAAGLTLADVNITHDVLHLPVRPNTFRNLKTAGSERTI